MQSTFRQRLLASTFILGAATLATPAWAQDAEAEEPGASVTGASSVADQADIAAQEAVTGDAIIVTGSRIARPQLEGASPVTVVNSQEVKLQGITRTEDLLNSLPQVFAGQGGNIANGASGTATINLRGLGAQRTLVLVNGRRLLPGDTGSSAADINIIPAAMIDRVDVLTGGASSVYGSDAISGVVNFVLDTDFEGVRLDTQ
jgi:outer membrane receptor protein involved in Fe transport